nr:MAG TPA: hypothetical protein [Caudoviricetes sp.]
MNHYCSISYISIKVLIILQNEPAEWGQLYRNHRLNFVFNNAMV